MIDKATAERIKNAADIVEVVSDYVHLIRRGSNFMGLCPFHNERTPSFSVNRRRNFCYCFSCHKGGSPVNFIMEKEGVSYHDALLQLADKYGIKVEERELSAEERAAITQREAMLVANDWAMKQMQADMRDTEEGRNVGLQYFYQRGITEEAIREFRLGYALDNGQHLTEKARNAGFDMQVMHDLGLVGRSQQGREYDRFRGRVIFPILNSSGKPIAFGGRDLKGGPAKYINSPESQIYVKSNELYGIYQAKNEIVRQDRCFLVEGYMDVIGMWQAGMKNVIASSGTALTDGQIALIHRFTENVTLLYDGDAAGVKAALRGIDMLLSHKMKVKVLLLPDGKDPDEFARDHTPEEFRKYVEEHETDIIRFKAQVLMAHAKDDPQKRAGAIMSVVQSIACIPQDVERTVYVGECARIFGVDENSVGAAVGKAFQERMEKLRQDRQRRDGHRDLDRNYPTGSQDMPDNSDRPDNSRKSQFPTPNSSLLTSNSPLEPLERRIIENCIKYGLMDFCDGIPAEGTPADVPVPRIDAAQFMKEELEADGISLTVPVYARILGLFDELRPAFAVAVAEKEREIRQRQQGELRQSVDRLSTQALSITEIEKEEKKLGVQLESELAAELDDFTRNYAGIALASHEDEEVRRVVNSIINEKYRLSNIFLRNNPNAEKQEDLENLIPRALTELKNEILNIRISDVKKQLAAAAEAGDDAAQEEAMQQLGVLLRMRSIVARNIGDRILSPKRK